MRMQALIMAGLAGLSAIAMGNPSDPTEISAPISKIFIPEGFDDNDNIEVILRGDFPDTCHQIGRALADVDTVNKTITVSATAYRYPGRFCIQSITPFIQSVPLGIIGAGEYEVVYKQNQDVRSSFEIARRTTESADDFLYATVENAYIDVNPVNGKQAIKLQGHFPMFFVGCMVIKDVKTSRAPADVLVVQPIAEIVNNELCAQQPSDRSFEYTVGLPSPFAGEGLLHVRTLNGSSLNRFINLPANDR